ncbi:hypothetical protein X801_02829 [Opisthorchis viverrini]|uniref:Exoribonuclease phosphorolytic domain-containing protein n=1 Tax=Opisthorchis viverrini TaxID=6198 RepID=A0A1S8X3I6_OPIVI|nr:hypothetical protein X801_02829 [Opisthorchis viverrini]
MLAHVSTDCGSRTPIRDVDFPTQYIFEPETLIMPIECFKLPSEAVDLEVFTEKKMRQDGQLITALKFAPFITWQQPDQQTGVERRLSQLLLSSIEASVMLHCFPRGKYEVMVLILDNGGFPVDSINTGDCLAAAITCSGLALTDASVQMYDTPVGVNVDLSTVVRPSSSVGHLCAAILPNLQQYSMLYTSDSCIRTGQDLREALSCAMNGGVQLATTIKQCLVRQTNTTA